MPKELFLFFLYAFPNWLPCGSPRDTHPALHPFPSHMIPHVIFLHLPGNLWAADSDYCSACRKRKACRKIPALLLPFWGHGLGSPCSNELLEKYLYIVLQRKSEKDLTEVVAESPFTLLKIQPFMWLGFPKALQGSVLVIRGLAAGWGGSHLNSF